MGGEWDSTNTADGDVAVFAPIDIDHADRLGSTIAEIAEVKAGIIKEGAAVGVGPAARRGGRGAASGGGGAQRDHRLRGRGSSVSPSRSSRSGGQLPHDPRPGGEYAEEYLPLYGAHQGHNAALAVAAVESLIGGATQRIAADIVTAGLQESTSPGRLHCSASPPTVIVDAGAQPARRQGRSLRRWTTASTSTSGVWCSVCSPTRTPPVSSLSWLPPRLTCSPPLRIPTARANADAIADLVRAERTARDRAPLARRCRPTPRVSGPHPPTGAR